jgi:hypothetical protein
VPFAATRWAAGATRIGQSLVENHPQSGRCAGGKRCAGREWDRCAGGCRQRVPAEARDVTGKAWVIRLAQLDIHTVGAGGGSIAASEAGCNLQVGPENAGAVPGPGAYGKGGTRPTITDANVVLGRTGAGVRTVLAHRQGGGPCLRARPCREPGLGCRGDGGGHPAVGGRQRDSGRGVEWSTCVSSAAFRSRRPPGPRMAVIQGGRKATAHFQVTRRLARSGSAPTSCPIHTLPGQLLSR